MVDAKTSSSTLYLFTASFPFAPGEEFLSEEIELLAATFDICFVIPTNYIQAGTKIGSLPENVSVIATMRASSKVHYKIYKLIEQTLLNPTVIFESFRSSFVNSNHKISFKAFTQELKYLSKVQAISSSIQEQLRSTNPNVSNSLFYSYWLHTPASVALHMKKEFKLKELHVVSRAHGFDIYEDRQPSNYLPQRKELLEGLDEIAFVSKAGLKHVDEKYSKYKPKYALFRLGVGKKNEISQKSKFQFSIVTCSYLQEVKRIELIPEVLKVLSDRGLDLKWTHIGGGTEMQQRTLTQKTQKLIPNLNFEITGLVSNEEAKERLRFSNFDLFLNVSSSEGVPVAGMDALAGGLPLLMTDVGGSRELFDTENGMFDGLLSSNPEIVEIANKIEEFYSEPFANVQSYSQSSTSNWEKNWNSTTNYQLFSKHLINKLKD